MRTLLIWVIVMAVLAVPPVAGAASGLRYRLTYDECVEMALKNNDQIRAADQGIRNAEGRLSEAHPRGIPVVKYEYRLAPVPEDVDNASGSFFGGDISVFNAFKIEMGSPITSFGKIRTAQDLAALGLDAAWFKRRQSSDDVAFKISQVYYGILLARELLGLADQARDAISGKISELEKEKVIDQLQILKLKVALYEVERKVEEAMQKEALAIATLKFLTGLEQDVDLDIASRSLTPLPFKLQSLQYYLDSAKSYLPEYRLLETGLAAREKQLKLEKLAPAPNLGVGGFFDIGRAPNIRGTEDDSSFTNPFNYTKAGVGLQLKGEFDYVKTSAKIKQTKADVLKTVYEKRAAIRGLELDLQRVYIEVGKAKSLMNKAANEKKAARQMVFLTKSNLDIGLGERKDYLDALQSYLIFQGREYEAIYNYNIAIFDLKKRIGMLYEDQGKEMVP